ncbi:hypothetical protein D3C79_827320 [compost metagenome]
MAHRDGVRHPAVGHRLTPEPHEVAIGERHRAGGLDLLLQLLRRRLEIGGLPVRDPGGYHRQRHRVSGKPRQIEPALADGDLPQPVEIQPVTAAHELRQADELGATGVIRDDAVVAPLLAGQEGRQVDRSRRDPDAVIERRHSPGHEGIQHPGGKDAAHGAPLDHQGRLPPTHLVSPLFCSVNGLTLWLIRRPTQGRDPYNGHASLDPTEA